MMISQSSLTDHWILVTSRGSLLRFCVRKQLGGRDGRDGRDDSSNLWWSATGCLVWQDSGNYPILIEFIGCLSKL